MTEQPEQPLLTAPNVAPSSPPPPPPAPAGLSSDPKEAYFQLLRVWLQQAHLSQNASACFPYYLMANYPQLFVPSTGMSQLPGDGSLPAENLPNIRLGLNYMFNRNALRQDEHFDNPVRNRDGMCVVCFDDY